MKSKKERAKKFRFNVINLKLLSNQRNGKVAYEQIFNKLVSNRVHIPVRGGKHVIIRTCFNATFDEIVYQYGKISKFTKLETNDWININNMKVENVEIPYNKFPNLTETDYLFIPDLHRFAILIQPGMTVNNAYKFWTEGVKDLLNEDEEMQFIIEQSRDIFEEIIKSKAIKKLNIEVTPTNDDIEEEALEYMDEEIKEMQASKLKLQIYPNQKDELSIKSKVLNGILGLARSNGEVEAEIIDQQDHKRKIQTKDHPNIYEFRHTNLDDARQSLVSELKRVFRSGRRSN